MAETTNEIAHWQSIDLRPNSIHMLNGQRYPNVRNNFDNNQPFLYPENLWDIISNELPDNDGDLVDLAQKFVHKHFYNQVPRILQLERYYQADNNIHYWKSDKSKKRADNRIASGLPRYITNIKVGYQFGNPIKFNYSNANDSNDLGQSLMAQITTFNNQNDEPYHEKLMGINLKNTGRAYELLYIPKDEKTPRMTTIEPATCFVVFNTDVEPKALFAVRYYAVNVDDVMHYEIEIYTDSYVFTYSTDGNDPSDDWTQEDDPQPHYFGSVPITEYLNNREKTGAWESKLDEIDAYDKTLSEMANSQEDFSNSTLVISGHLKRVGKKHILVDSYNNPVYMDNKKMKYTSNKYDSDGMKNNVVTYKEDLTPDSNILQLENSVIPSRDGGNTIIPTNASYLTKNLDANEWQIYKNALLQDIHKETNTPDTSDQNFSSNASGVAMAYKLWGADQERSISETLYKRGIMQRLRLLGHYWNIKDNGFNTDIINNINIVFTPNLPKNNDEVMNNLNIENQLGVSKQTMFEQLTQVDGVSPETESQRIKDEQDDQDTRDVNLSTNIQQKQNAQNNTGNDVNE
ncbi:phage portal protein [Apilactobacillus micheneri]|uniref:Phage portal protein n=1 Tax=Apilactobacillus micheneri TaxID=1899430 RepID=A0ABY2YUY5_9LACO|nr:phage portal protein [Apilactobacillus micheneri]TPR23102.1 phage portal protein [Apilactobacillus micheneri]TPR24420.1 phage portal protein [Apilactobacillus micheneri]TPR29367.1 phage portal protein [Apilactobacillus micheneri]TPR34574.1 phage portal protein [Apilactobacillus micheneri]